MDDATPPPEPEAPPGPSEPKLEPGAVAFLTMGVAAALCVVIGGGLGYVIDRGAGTSPLFTLIGLGFGLVTAVVMAVARIREYL